MENDGSDNNVVNLATKKQQKELVILGCFGKLISNTTSGLLHYKLEEVVPKCVLQMEEEIVNHEFGSFVNITCVDSNKVHAVFLDTSPPIFYMNDTSHVIINFVERWNQCEGTPEFAYA